MLFVHFLLPGVPDRSGTVCGLKKYLIRLWCIASQPPTVSIFHILK